MNENVKNSNMHLEDDAPELGNDFFLRADLYEGEKLLRRGRPKQDATKTITTIRLDSEVVEQFKAGGKGWQTRINNALKEWLEMHE
ncbi:BrnA antitoxin family protein [Rappaport israeli]|uniref:BrnA antitoxin family protein n=1 Tax=Rappaport israeli TaxID=1839807 RepID=UPI000930DA9A|nr:BrnA antitoxin family protein [Rappaport israeli]